MTTALRPNASDEELLRHYQRRADQRQITATTADRVHWQVGKHEVVVGLLPNGHVNFNCNCPSSATAPCLHLGAVVNAIGQDLNEHDD